MRGTIVKYANWVISYGRACPLAATLSPHNKTLSPSGGPVIELQDFRAARRAISSHMRLTPVF
ncbi:hypothetical protein, partial [Thalassospira lucentensis]|uniref:hypothetical protein n=1 Tax=Thalassospira lucentensis TaxID=168935 RepID=UPI003AA954C4